VTAATGDRDYLVRAEAINSLGRFPEGAEESVPIILKALERGPAASAMTSLKQLGSAAVPGLIEAVRKCERESKRPPMPMLEAIADRGTEAFDAVPVLIKLLHKPWHASGIAAWYSTDTRKDVDPWIAAVSSDRQSTKAPFRDSPVVSTLQVLGRVDKRVVFALKGNSRISSPRLIPLSVARRAG
jgi:hypothetical protein